MTRTQLNRSIAARTGESLSEIRRLGIPPAGRAPRGAGRRGDPPGRALPVLPPAGPVSRPIPRRLERPGRVRRLRRLLRVRGPPRLPGHVPVDRSPAAGPLSLPAGLILPVVVSCVGSPVPHHPDPIRGESSSMITLTRNQVRRLRQVFRRSALGITHKGTIPPLVLRAEGAQLRAHYRYRDLAVECVEPGSYRPAMSLAIPLDALADFEGSEGLAGRPGGGRARPDRRPLGGSRDPSEPRVRGHPPSTAWASSRSCRRPGRPTRPGCWRRWPTRPRRASPTRPATPCNCVQLQGGRDQIVATDGRQLLVRSGFRLPWTGDVLIKGSPIFACRTLPRDRPVEVGRTDSHVFFRSRPLDDRLRDPEGGPVPGRRAGHPAGLGGPDPAAAGPRGRAASSSRPWPACPGATSSTAR